jgi:hypothetical protein
MRLRYRPNCATHHPASPSVTTIETILIPASSAHMRREKPTTSAVRMAASRRSKAALPHSEDYRPRARESMPLDGRQGISMWLMAEGPRGNPTRPLIAENRTL